MVDLFNPISAFPLQDQNLLQPRVGSPALPLSPEEQQSLLDRIGSGALHGLGWIGGSLSKAFGGRAIRGLLGGRPEELLSAIPFSDTLGITDPVNEVHGSDLLGGDHNTSFFSPEGIGGLGIDIVTDPATWFGAPIAKAIGKGAQLAGKTALKVPGVSQAIEKVGDPLYRGALSLFDKSVLGQTNPSLQDVARGVSSQIPAAEAAARSKVTPLMEDLARLGGYTGGEVTPALKQNVDSLGRELAMLVEGNHPGGAMPELVGLADRYKNIMAENWTERGAAGLNKTQAQPSQQLGYLTRQATEEQVNLGAKGRKLSPSQVPGREEAFMEPVQLPREGKGLNELSMRADIANMQPLVARDVIATEYLGQTPQTMNEWQQLRSMPAAQRTPQQSARLDELSAIFAQAENLAGWNRSLDHAKLQQIGGFFANHPFVDMETKLVRDSVNFLKADGVSQGIAKVAQPLAALGAEGVPISQVLVDAGLTFGTDLANPAAMQNTLTALQKASLLPSTATVNDLANFAVPREIVPMLTKLIKAGTSPDGLNPFIQLWDSITNLNKAFVTQLWPANHTRNQVTAMGQNWLHDAFYPAIGNNPAGYVKPWLDATAWQQGKMIPGLSQFPDYAKAGLNDEQAWKAMLQEIYQWNVPGGKKQLSKELIGSSFAGAKEMPIIGAPGGSINPLTKIQQAIPTTLEEAKPWKTAGAFGETRDIFAPVKAGRELGSDLDQVNRVSVYLAKRSQGLSPEAAYKEVLATHFDFTNLSEFERSVMRRLVPFYSWARQVTPSILGDLAKNPGGKTGMAIRGLSEMGGQNQGFTPDYLGAGLAAKIGEKSPEGLQTFLSSTGLPIEDLAQYTKPEGYLSQLNPLLKGPLELLTNRQFFTGRDLSGAVPHSGSAVGDELLNASPLARFASTGRNLLDPRSDMLTKIFNLLGAGRLSEVNMPIAQQNAIRDYAQQRLAGLPQTHQFNRTYIPNEQIPTLSPAELEAYRLLLTTQRR